MPNDANRLKTITYKLVKTTIMYWTLELASKLEDAPWPATKEELIDYAIRSGAPLEVLENLQSIEDDSKPWRRNVQGTAKHFLIHRIIGCQ